MEYHYLQLANSLEEMIRTGGYKAGEKLPSLRAMRQQSGRSISTVYHAYEELEQRGLVDVREKSGFFIRPLVKNLTVVKEHAPQGIRPLRVVENAMAQLLQHSSSNPDVLTFGTALPGPELLPGKQIAQEMRKAAAKWANGELISYCDPNGYLPLCDEIEKRMIGSFNSHHGDEVMVTGGCLAAIDLCLRAVAKSGDIILVESPTFICYLQLIEDLNLVPLEIPVNPEKGIDPELLETVLAKHKVSAALLNTNFQNPLGYAMDEKSKKRIVGIFLQRSIPIIEDDIYGELYFGKKRPLPLKYFDEKGLVLYCSSFSKTMAPDLRVGWTVAGKFREKIKRMKFNSSVANQQLTQHVAASFLASGGFDRHLRKMRNSLRRQQGSFLKAIAEYFPGGTRVSRPNGGLCLWLELDEGVDTMDIFHKARSYNIGLVPGKFCSVTDKFNNCMRLNYGYPWNSQSEKNLQILGALIAGEIENKT